MRLCAEKRTAYLVAFIEFIRCKVLKRKFEVPELRASYLHDAMHRLVGFVQRQVYGKVVQDLCENSLEAFDKIMKRHCDRASKSCRQQLVELRRLKKYSSCG